MARVVPFQIGGWISHCDFMVIYLRDFELVLDMDFLMEEKVGILPYLGSLAFLEFGTPYVVKIVLIEEEPNFGLTRMVPTSNIVGVWPEGNNNQGVGDQVSHGSGQVEKIEGRQGEDVKSESTRTSTSFWRGWVCYPSWSCD